MYALRVVFCIVLFVFGNVSLADNFRIGAYDTVNIQAAIGPLTGTGNALYGFAVFLGGFALTDAATLVDWDCFYPVQGDISLNNGTTILMQDFVMASNAVFSTGGVIAGKFQIVLPEVRDIFTVPDAMIMEDVTLVCNSKTSVAGTLTFRGNCIIEGQGNSINLDGSIVVDSDSSLYVKNCTIEGISQASIVMTSTASRLVLDNTTWIQSSTYTFTQGSLDLINKNTFMGGATFAYSSTGSCTIHDSSQLLFDAGMTFSFSSPVRTSVVLQDKTSTLYFLDTILYSDSPGIVLTKGTIVVDGPCPVYSLATSEDDGIWLGDGVVEDNVEIQLMPDSGFDIRTGYVVYKNI